MIRAHQPGSQPIDIPEVIPNPAVVPKQNPLRKNPLPKSRSRFRRRSLLVLSYLKARWPPPINVRARTWAPVLLTLHHG